MGYWITCEWDSPPVWGRSRSVDLLNPDQAVPQNRETGCPELSNGPRDPRRKLHLDCQTPLSFGLCPESIEETPPNASWRGRSRSLCLKTLNWTKTADSSLRRRGSVVVPLAQTRTNLRKSTGACTPPSYCKGADAARVYGLHYRASWRNTTTQGEQNLTENQHSRDLKDSAHTFPWSFPQTLLASVLATPEE